MNKIINPQSPYFNQPCRILKKLEDQKVQVFLEKEEMLIEIPLDDVDVKKTVAKPKTRKDFYCLVQDPDTARKDIRNTLELFIQSGFIVTKEESRVIGFFDDLDKDCEVLVQEFREMRDAGVFEFNLPNNSYPEKRPVRKHEHDQRGWKPRK